MIEKQKIVALPDRLQKSWLAFRDALDAAASPFTAEASLPLSPDYGFSCPEISRWVDSVMASGPSPAEGRLVLAPGGTRCIALEVVTR
jgi:hypothetical protein